MVLTNKKKDAPAGSSGARTGKRVFLWAILLWLAMAVVLALNWRRFETYIFYRPFRTIEDFLQRVESTAQEGSSSASLVHLRLPASSDSGGYLTVPQVPYPEGGTKTYTVRVKKGERVEGGFVRVRDGYNPPT